MKKTIQESFDYIVKYVDEIIRKSNRNTDIIGETLVKLIERVEALEEAIKENK